MAVSAHTLVAPLRPACLGGGPLFVLLVLLLRRPFPGVLKPEQPLLATATVPDATHGRGSLE